MKLTKALIAILSTQIFLYLLSFSILYYYTHNNIDDLEGLIAYPIGLLFYALLLPALIMGAIYGFKVYKKTLAGSPLVLILFTIVILMAVFVGPVLNFALGDY